MIDPTSNCLEFHYGPPQSPNSFRKLVNALPGMIYQCRNDSAWTMEFVSEGCTHLTGYTPDDFLFKRIASYGDLIHPDDFKTVWMNVQSAVEKRKPFELTYRIRTRSGLEKWVHEWRCGVFNSDGKLCFLEGLITDISDRNLAEMRIQRQNDRFKTLREIDATISNSSDLQHTLVFLLDQIVSQLYVDAADILLYKPNTELLEYGASKGFRTNALQFTRLRLGEGYAGRAALSGEIVHVHDLRAESGWMKQSGLLAEEGFQQYHGLPLYAKGHIMGVLEVFRRSHQAVDPEWLDFLEALAGQAAIAIDNALMYLEIQQSNLKLRSAYDATLEGWVKALELRDRETMGHTYRVITLTLRLAKVLGVGDDLIPHIRRGALLHDIGKMGIPDAVLLKPGPLTPDEWDIMRQHPVYAFEMLRPIDYLWTALDIPYSHHEKWDGTGYPCRLRENEIPLAARIFAVADVWDALTSDRPYRSAWPKEKVEEYIRSETGKHFDPQVVQVFQTLREPLSS